jgi:hypothetical protein
VLSVPVCVSVLLFLTVPYVCVGRPKPTAFLLKQQRKTFKIYKAEIEAIRKDLIKHTKKDTNGGDRRDPVLDTKKIIGNKDRKDSFEETQIGGAYEVEATNEVKVNNEEDANGGNLRGLVSDTKKEGGGEDQKANLKETKIEKETSNEEEEVDDDVSRKDPFYGSEEATGAEATEPPLPPVATELLLFVAVIVGLVIAWCTRKVQRKRSGLHKKIDEYAALHQNG